ncbi:MAG: GNAT family N-acetyltransferase [Nocardioides sp.]|uniref:GNAT family N-acetyltransferase n=1 Tax=Nocardioides sp. TaxID=35761 RepID=UPI003F07D430
METQAPGQLEIVRVPITHPDAADLVEQVQLVYVERYGGRDESPVDPAEFEDPTGQFFVGRVDGQPVASGAWRRHRTPAGVEQGPCAEVKRMFVRPSHQGRGYARRMLAHVEETALAAGIATVVLETGLAQPEAIALYGSSGYVAIPNFGYHADQPLSRCFAKALRTTDL